ncbi:MAG: 30S ribosomal protein S9 [Candidatus Moranbacteria bacterium CG23_combo_of_CG06-09_8_20_14_all_39_10]|nr:MAG: 30S ribosomal protein S9 [Candidatus Moranbacteria bacterium CG23_combo_of_CG06-09_8_20_14_all_39_10]
MPTKKVTTKTVKVKAPVKVKEVKEIKEAKIAPEVKAVKEVKTTKETKEFVGKYFYAVGKRKTSIAQVRLYPVDKADKGIVVNGKPVKTYFTIERHSDTLKAPLVAAGLEGKFDISVKVVGGGITGQAEAVRLGVARALIIHDETLKKLLKDLGYLTRNARVVERKKPGRKKARRSPQWAKR